MFPTLEINKIQDKSNQFNKKIIKSNKFKKYLQFNCNSSLIKIKQKSKFKNCNINEILTKETNKQEKYINLENTKDSKNLTKRRKICAEFYILEYIYRRNTHT